MSRTHAKYNWMNGAFPLVYDKTTQESILPMFPVVFYDDFIGAAGGDIFDGTIKWNTVLVTANATCAIVANSSCGEFMIHLAVDDEAEDSVLYMGDNKNFDAGEDMIFEARVNVKVLPTLGAEGIWGMITDHNLDNDTIAVGAFFKLDGSGALLLETDDTTNDNDDTATGVTIVAGVYHVYRIDFNDTSDVKFYMDNVRLAPATTFDMSNMTAAEHHMQPYFELDKASTAGVGSIVIDYVRIFSDREA